MPEDCQTIPKSHSKYFSEEFQGIYQRNSDRIVQITSKSHPDLVRILRGFKGDSQRILRSFPDNIQGFLREILGVFFRELPEDCHDILR